MKFPDGFLWGTATAAHQVEGGNWNCDCWLLEHVEGTPYAEPSADACDHFHRYPADLALLSALGFNSYRFSIEWARIEPEDGEFSVAALDHYRRMLAACHERNLVPVVTFHHFTSPRWLAARGGWEWPEAAMRFARYCERAVAHLGDLIGAACTINELNLPILLQQWGWVPGDEVIVKAPFRVAGARALGVDAARFSAFPFCVRSTSREVLLEAHRLGAGALRAGRGKFGVGMTIAMAALQAAAGGEQRRDRAWHEAADVYLDAARGDDFVGVQTYTRTVFGPDGALAPERGAELTQMGYEFWPEALEATIRHAHAIARVPIMVTENGIGTEDDTRRVAYVERALKGVANCLTDGIDVRGYFYWSMLDNFEWLFGYRPKFGLVAVDRNTQRRIVKPSADWLGRIARANAI
jgi:beta-glucosidase